MTIGKGQYLIDGGLHVCHCRGKAPVGMKWQTKSVENHDPRWNLGLIHHMNQTCAIDIDDLEKCRIAFNTIGINIDSIISEGVQIIGNPENRAKAIFRVPMGIELKTHSFNWIDHHLFELRCGLGSQDVIYGKHPDGYEYQIYGDIFNPPLLPDAMLHIWRNWQHTKKILESTDPKWIPVTTYAQPRPSRTGQESVIDRFNSEFTPFQLLIDHGYTAHGDRLLRPGSSSQIPAVKMFDNGRQFYSWGGDEFNDNKPHDAFDVFCRLDHGGDTRLAVKAAAELLGIKTTPEAKLLEFKKRDPDTVSMKQEAFELEYREVPNHRPPVKLVCDLMDFFSLANGNTPAFALTQSALAFCSAMFARRFAFNSRSPIGIYMGTYSDSLAQLSSLVGVIQGAVADCQERKIIRSDAFSSSAYLKKAFSQSPRIFWVTAEYISAIAFSSKQNNSRGYDSAASLIRTAYSGSRIFIDAETWGARQDAMDIWQPALTICAFMASGELYKITKKEEYDRGTLQQILITEPGPLVYPQYPDTPFMLPDDIKEYLLLAKPQGDLAKLENPCTAPPFTEIKSNVDLDSYQLGFNELADHFREWQGVAYGWFKIFKRMCGVLAVANDIYSPRVTAEIAEWANDWVKYHLWQFLNRLTIIGSDLGDPDIYQKVRDIIYKSGSKGATIKEINDYCRPFRKLPKIQKDELLEHLLSDKQIAESKTGKGVRYLDSSFGRFVEKNIELRM